MRRPHFTKSLAANCSISIPYTLPVTTVNITTDGPRYIYCTPIFYLRRVSQPPRYLCPGNSGTGPQNVGTYAHELHRRARTLPSLYTRYSLLPCGWLVNASAWLGRYNRHGIPCRTTRYLYTSKATEYGRTDAPMSCPIHPSAVHQYVIAS